MKVSIPEAYKTPLNVVEKKMTGAGPSNYHPRVKNSMSLPIMGHLHPETLKIMDDIKEGIKYLFQTNNSLTFCVSGPGHAGLECALVNLIEDGDVLLIAKTGIWGQRAENIAKRFNADIKILEKRPGEPLTVDEAKKYFQMFKPNIFFLAHGESSTGLLQHSLESFGNLCREFECIFVLDSVISLGCVPIYTDDWKIDVIYTGTQKVLNAPPGITPISFNERASVKIKSRKSLVKSYNYDPILLGEYWNCFNGRPRIYHHTICPTLLYGLRESIAVFIENGGLESSWEKHARVSRHFYDLLSRCGLKLFIEDVRYRCPSVTSIITPKNVDIIKVSMFAMKKYNVEIAGGLGPTLGKVFRVGLMGVNANEKLAEHVVNILVEAINNSVIDKLSKM